MSVRSPAFCSTLLITHVTIYKTLFNLSTHDIVHELSLLWSNNVKHFVKQFKYTVYSRKLVSYKRGFVQKPCEGMSLPASFTT